MSLVQIEKGKGSAALIYRGPANGTIYAKGIHVGGGSIGGDDFGGRLDPCQEYFTDIWDAYLGFPGYLTTS